MLKNEKTENDYTTGQIIVRIIETIAMLTGLELIIVSGFVAFLMHFGVKINPNGLLVTFFAVIFVYLISLVIEIVISIGTLAVRSMSYVIKKFSQ